MREYPEGQCDNPEFHLQHTTFLEDELRTCPGVGEGQEYVYRLVDEKTGTHLQAYGGQYVYTERSQARAQCTKFNKKSWRNEKAVIQRGLIQWSTDPV